MPANATINIEIRSHHSDSVTIPKLIELFDSSLNQLSSQWISSNELQLTALSEGIYVIRLSLSSGIKKDKTLKVKDGETATVTFDLGGYSPYESSEWAYFTKAFAMESSINQRPIIHSDPGRSITVDLYTWSIVQEEWQRNPMPVRTGFSVSPSGDNIDLQLNGNELNLLEVGGDSIPTLFVSLPAYDRIRCFLKLAEKPGGTVHPIDVTVASDNKKAETILSLLVNGATNEVKKLTNAAEAEEMLMHKMIDPLAAAIGGYFLLKVGELDRMHNWAGNLAHRFMWMPDAAIIFARQMMCAKEDRSDYSAEIRRWLLEAVKRGIPIYTEGLRILKEALTMYWYYTKQQDSEISEALEWVNRYVEVADFTQETTTFTGDSPAEPRPVGKLEAVIG